MFRKSITTVTIAAAAFVALGSSTPASAAGFDCYAAPAHCKKVPSEIVPVDLSQDVTLTVVDPMIPEPTADVPKLKGDFPIGSLIVPLEPGETNDDNRVPVLKPPNSNDHTHVVPSGHNTPDPGDGQSTPTEPPADDPDNGHTAEVGPDTSTNTSTATPSTEEPGADTSANMSTATLNTEEPGAEAISLADQSAEINASTTFNPMMAALFGVLASLTIVSLAGAAFAAGRRRN